MPCPKCQSIRLLCHDAILCPNCDNVKIDNIEDNIQALRKEYADAHAILDQLLKYSNYNDIFYHSLIKREESAAILLESPDRKDAARDWITASFILSMNDSSNIGESVPFKELFYAAEQAIIPYNLLRALENGQRVVLEDGQIVPTEKEGLGFIPRSVLSAIKESLDIKGFEDKYMRSGELMIQELAFSQLDLIRSETLSRTLRLVFHQRLVPHINDSLTSTAFVDTCHNLAGVIGFTLGPAFTSNYGTLEATPSLYSFIQSQIEKRIDPDLTTSFFLKMGNGSCYDINNLGYTCLLQNELSGNFHLPYYSLLILGMATYKRISSPMVGRAHNFKGTALEEIIFNGVSGYLDTLHPIEKTRLLRYDLPDGQGDIDIGGFNNETLCVIESKFWDTPNVAALEVELNKFDRTIQYIKDNLRNLGFNPALKILPLFYTPYPPYANWGEITLIPSIFLLFWILGSKFGLRDLELLDNNDAVSAFLEDDQDERSLPLDLSVIFEELPENTFRIQDAILDSIDDNEVTVFVLMPGLKIFPIICDINEHIAEKLRKLEICPGSLIRIALYNVSGGWTPTQLFDFKIVKIATKRRLDPWIELTLANPQSTLDDFVKSIWGDDLGKEILGIISKWEIDLLNLINRLSEKGQNVLSGIGIALGLTDTYEYVTQCSCGEIVACSKATADSLIGMYEDGKIQCKVCDPTYAEKLRKIHGHEVTAMTLGDVLILAAKHHRERTLSDAS